MILGLVLTFLIVFVAVFGDKLISEIHYSVYKALADSSTHGSIGLLSWTVVCFNTNTVRNLNFNHCVEIIVCGCIASLIDVDHFIAARSFKLKEALKLKTRAPFHSTSMLILVFFSLNIFAKITKYKLLERMSWNIFVAGGSHHLRDAYRRGLWFPPFGSTPPLHLILYLGSIALLPQLASIFMPATTFVPKNTRYMVV